MAGNLVGQNPGFMQMALPVALGVGAAFSPRLARSASLINSMLQQGQRTRRLREVMEMERQNQQMRQEQWEYKKNVEYPARERHWEAQERQWNKPQLYNMGAGQWGTLEGGQLTPVNQARGLSPAETEQMRFQERMAYLRHNLQLKAQENANILSMKYKNAPTPLGPREYLGAMKDAESQARLMLGTMAPIMEKVLIAARPEEANQFFSSVIAPYQQQINEFAKLAGVQPVDLMGSMRMPTTPQQGTTLPQERKEFVPRVQQAKDGSVFVEKPDGTWRKASPDEVRRLKTHYPIR